MPASQKQRSAAAAARAPERRVPVVAIALGGVVLLAVIAIVITSLSGGGKSTTVKDDRPLLEQTRPVTVTGTVLPPFDDTAKSDPAVGMVAPTINGQAFDGTPIAIANDGTPKLVLFVAHWCPHCRREVPLLSQWLRTNQPPAGVKIMTVSTGVQSNAPNFPPSAWLEKEQWSPPTIADDAKGTAARAFGLSGYPYFVAIDGNGKVLARTSGEQPIEVWEQLLARAAAKPAG